MATYTPADEATKARVIEEATRLAKANGTTPEQELWSYAQANGYDSAGVDTFMGLAPGSTGAWLGQRDAAITSGQQPAPQGYSYTPTPAQRITPLDSTQRASVAQNAQGIASKYGISPEMALWNYANQNGIDAAGIDSYMGFAQGTSSDWAAKNGFGVGGSQSKNLGMGGLPAALDPTQRASVVSQAEGIAKSQGITPEQALYNYAQKNNISNAGIDAYMGYKPGAADTWLEQNPQGQSAGSNLGMGGGYNPQQNPYLGQMGRDIGSQMFDNWSRTQMPSIRSGAMAAGGFGGSRQGVVEANGMNDMNRQYGQALTSMYGNDWSQQQGRNLQQQGLNNSYDLGLRSNELQNRSVNNSYDLGLRSSDLGFANLDANINQNNFGNQMQAANFGMGVYNTLNNQTQSGINAGTNIQNTPLDYQKYFTNSANGVGSGYSTGTTSQTNQGNPLLGALGGAQIGNAWQYPNGRNDIGIYGPGRVSGVNYG